MTKLLYVSHSVPPLVRGSSVQVFRLLRHFPRDSYVLFTSELREIADHDPNMNLPCHCYYSKVRMTVFAFKWRRVLRWLSEVLLIVRDGWRVIRQERIGHILISPTSGSGNLWLGMCLLHWLTRIPLSLYFFDMFSQRCDDKLDLRMRQLTERMLIPVASQVFVNSEPLGDLYKQRIGGKPIVLPNPIEYPPGSLNPYMDDCVNNSSADGSYKIVFTGMIYEAQRDALLNLVNVVIEKLPNVELHLYTPVTKDKLRWMGIIGERVIYHGCVSNEKIRRVQTSADILVLPLSFEYDDVDLIRTASPTKLPEYLASSRVILIHAPEYSYAAWYGKKYRCAEVVDIPDIDVLYKAVCRLINDKTYSQDLVANAKKAAKRHESERVSLKLQRHLSIA